MYNKTRLDYTLKNVCKHCQAQGISICQKIILSCIKVMYALQCIKLPHIYVGSLDKQAESSTGA